MTVRILGCQDGIDASACLLEDGVIKFALQEERFSGVKEHEGFPYASVRRILKMAKLTIEQIDELALATEYVTVLPGVEGHTTNMSFQQWLKDKFPVAFGVYEDNIPVLKERYPRLLGKFGVRRNRVRLAAIRAKTGFTGPIIIVQHHIAHAASGYYSSSMRDSVLVLSLDASGDGLCATVNVGNEGTFHRIARTVHGHSPGYLYTAVTGYLGMKQRSHEWKTMGLAPYSPLKYAEKPYETFKSYLGLDGLEFKRKISEPLHHIKPRLKNDLFQCRFDGIAAGLQRFTEELTVQWTKTAMHRTGLSNVTAAGGLFMNVKLNKLLRELPEMDTFFPMPTAGDTTTSIGAAQWVYAQRRLEAGQEVNIKPLDHLYLGDEPTEREISEHLFTDQPDFERHGWDVLAHTRNVDDLAADLILKGEIIARCRGRMEFGARALGNRSILCDASDLCNVRTINQAIKSRDFFMPFAPVIVAGYRHILSRYHDETGRGGLLNTSYNLHGRPLVRSPDMAFGTFIKSGLKYLVLGDYLLGKVTQAP